MRVPSTNDGSATIGIACSGSNMCCLTECGRILHIDERSRRVVRVYNSGTEARAICFSPDSSPGNFFSIDKHGEVSD